MKNSEKRTNQLSRMFEILGMINSGKQCTRSGLSEYFEVSERTISRDLSLMSALFPVYYDTETGTYSFAGDYSFKDVNLSPEEIRALLMCRLIASNLGEPVSGPIDSLMKKLKVEMGKKSSKMLEKASASYAFDVKTMENIPVSSRRFEIIQEAVEENTTLVIKYTSGEDEGLREIDPYGLLSKLGLWYVVVCDHQDREIYILPLRRITDVKKTDKSFRPPSGFSVDDYIKKHPEKVYKEDLKELRDMLEWLDSSYTLIELTRRKLDIETYKAECKRLNKIIRKVQPAINERTAETRRLEQQGKEGKRGDTRLYEELVALNKADAEEIKHLISSRDYCRMVLKRGVVWNNIDNLSDEEVKTLLKEAGMKINRISVNEEFKKSAADLGNISMEVRSEEIEKEIAKLESMAKR